MKTLSAFGAVIVLAVAAQGRAAAQSQPACASIATPSGTEWLDSTNSNWGEDGVFKFQQDADGNISGTYSPPSGNECADTYSMEGSSQGNGTFAITGSDDTQPVGQYCTTSFTATVTVSGAGCATASMQWQNHSGFKGTDTLSDAPGVEPTGETTPLPLWQDSQIPTTYWFTQNLAPTTYDFVGRASTETFPNGLSNGCNKNPGSPIIAPSSPHTVYPELNTLGDGGTPVNGVTSSYGDQVGLDQATVNLIRGVGDAPCTVSTVQYIWIDISTGTGYYNYQINNIYITVGTNTMTDQRGPGQPITWKYLSPVQKTLPTVIVNGLLEQNNP